MSQSSMNFLKGGFALATNTLALVTSMQEHVEWALRCTSLVIGIVVGLLTAWSILRKKKG